jgi:hypothetical protein
VLLPDGFRFSPSTERPEWTKESEKALRSFHSRYADEWGRPPLRAYVQATLKHRDRVASGGASAIAAVAAEEKLNPKYLSALWAGLSGTSTPAVQSLELETRTQQWLQKVAEVENEQQRLQTALPAARKKIEESWGSSKRVLAEAKVAEGQSVSFEQKVSVQRGELLLLSVLANANPISDSTLVEWTIRETTGAQRSWTVSDLAANLLKGNPWSDKHGSQWSFLQTTKNLPVFLARGRESIAGNAALKSWSTEDAPAPEPAVLVNSAAEPVQHHAKLPAQSCFVHPGKESPVSVAWTSPIEGELMVSGRVADVHPAPNGDGVSFALSHVAASELGQALADLGSSSNPPDAGLPPDAMVAVRQAWRAATTDPAPVLAAIKALQGKLFWSNYGKHKVLAVGNGFPAWNDTSRVVEQSRVEGQAREALFRLVARQVAPAQEGTFVVWDRLRLEGGDGPTIVLAEHPELRAAVEKASGLRFGEHPQGHPVPSSALVTAAGTEVRIDLKKLPEPLLQTLHLPQFLRAEVRLDECSPETATVQALLLAQPDDLKWPGGWRAWPSSWRSGDPLVASEPEPRIAQIAHPRLAGERERPSAEFRALFPGAVLFGQFIPRDAQGSLFLFHREDEPLRRLILDEPERVQLERLWSEFHFVSENALAHGLMYADLMKFYANPNGGPRMDFFIQSEVGERVEHGQKAFLAAQRAAEPKHLDALLSFAERAWRRPLAAHERDAILAAYRTDRAEGIKHEPAFRGALARVLSSPWFLYRVELPVPGPRWQPVSGLELATRLSFFLWDSLPDDALRKAAPQLHEPAVLEAQLRRMLKDARTRGLAEEFGARWLGVRDFVANHGRSLKDFPEFTPALRDALAEEPIRFFEDLLRNDRPVSDVISADAVVVNEVLAKHYGIPNVKGAEWRRVEKVGAFRRGGLLGFGAILAKQSAAARTSPTKRGAWVAQLLGERLPKPPADVPPLPDSAPEGLSVREMTERHRQDPVCAACHVRIDPYGMALERFDALGRLRPDSQMKPGESHSTLRDGSDIEDFSGLRNYLVGPRRDDLMRSIARKLIGYALGRAALPSDRALVEQVTQRMASGGRWSDALLLVVGSEQFRCVRSAEATASASP